MQTVDVQAALEMALQMRGAGRGVPAAGASTRRRSGAAPRLASSDGGGQELEHGGRASRAGMRVAATRSGGPGQATTEIFVFLEGFYIASAVIRAGRSPVEFERLDAQQAGV